MEIKERKEKRKLKESLSKSLYTIKHPKTFLFINLLRGSTSVDSLIFVLEKALVPYFLKKCYHRRDILTKRK